MIHPTAIIDPAARLGADVEIGPYCVIGNHVTLGDRCRLLNHVTLAGPATIGSDNLFYPYAIIGQPTQDLKYQGEPTYLEIGSHNTFREFSTVHRATAPGSVTRIGSHGLFLSYSHIAHDCVVGDHVIFSNNGTLAGHVTVGDHAIISGLSAVHQFCRIGEHSIIGGCTKIVLDVPPYMIADGNPAEVRSLNLVGLERRGFSKDAIRHLKTAHRLLHRSKLNITQATEQIQAHDELPSSPEVQRLLAFYQSTSRGVTR